MKSLTEQEIKEIQLNLLLVEGCQLNQFAERTRAQTFHRVSSPKEMEELRKIIVKRVNTFKTNANANLQSFSWALLQSIFQRKIKEDVLYLLKLTFYNQELDLIDIKNGNGTPISDLSIPQTKKLLVQFLYEMVYSSMEHKAEIKLNKFPVILDIMVIFLRKILATFDIPNATNYDQPISTMDCYKLLADYFDLNCKNEGSLFLFYEDNLFIHSSNSQEAVFGYYTENPKSLVSHKIQCQAISLDDSLELMEKNEERKVTPQNRFLKLGLLKESIISELDADTPSFNFDESRQSFASSITSQFQYKEEFDQARQKIGNESPMKANDIKNTMKQSNDFFGSIGNQTDKRKLLESQLIDSSYKNVGFDKIMDTPVTANTPNKVIQSMINFQTMNTLDIHIKRNRNHLKNSKSFNCEETSNDFKHSQSERKLYQSNKVTLNRLSKHSAFECQCIFSKKQRNKLQSNIYQVNIIVSSYPTEIYVVSKGLSSEIYCRMTSSTRLTIPLQNNQFMKTYDSMITDLTLSKKDIKLCDLQRESIGGNEMNQSMKSFKSHITYCSTRNQKLSFSTKMPELRPEFTHRKSRKLIYMNSF